MITKKKFRKTILAIIVVVGIAIALIAWNPKQITAPNETANTTETTTPTNTNTGAETATIPEMLYLSEGESQPIFGERFMVTLQSLKQVPCTTELQNVNSNVNVPAQNPCTQLPTTATLLVVDKTVPDNQVSTSLLFPMIGAVQTQEGAVYQFVESNNGKARFIVRSLGPVVAPPAPTEDTSTTGGE